MPEIPPPHQAAAEICEQLNRLCERLGVDAGEDPLVQSLLRRLLMLEPAATHSYYLKVALDFGLLPAPHALTPDGRPLFTIQQLAGVFGLPLASLARQPGAPDHTD